MFRTKQPRSPSWDADVKGGNIVDIQEMKIVNAGSIKQTASHSCHIYFRLERNSTAIPSPRLNSPSAKRFAKCGFKESDRTPASQAAILAGGASEAIAAG